MRMPRWEEFKVHHRRSVRRSQRSSSRPWGDRETSPKSEARWRLLGE